MLVFHSVFQLAGLGVSLLQLRSPAVSGCEEAFAKELASWVSASRFRSVLVLAGADAAMRVDRQLRGQRQVRLASNGLPCDLLEVSAACGIPTLELPVPTKAAHPLVFTGLRLTYSLTCRFQRRLTRPHVTMLMKNSA